jgi:putative ATPase
MIFYGPPGIGKTTVANIIAEQTDMRIHKLNGTEAGSADIREILAYGKRNVLSEMFAPDEEEQRNGVLLYIDEIQYLNKKQQQLLLKYIETGEITLIAATTENPYFYVYNAILSRCTVFEFKKIEPMKIIPAIERAFYLTKSDVQFTNKEEILKIIAYNCGGDVRKAVTAAELCVSVSAGGIVTEETAASLSQKSSMNYDRDGDFHYDILSAFQKSVRGSDENAALHYLARLILASDLPSICRRLLVIAAEDIGLAYPNAITVVKSCVDSALQLGLPEARIPLAEAVILLCTSPKSNSGVLAIDKAISDIEKGNTGDIPANLKDSHYKGSATLNHGTGYKYPHEFPNHWTKQQYLPDKIKDTVYYNFGDNKLEQAAAVYRERITGQRKSAAGGTETSA